MFNTKKTIEYETQRVKKLQKEISDVGANVSKRVEPIRAEVNDDDRSNASSTIG